MSTQELAQFPNNWSHANMHGLHEISEKSRGPTLEFNSKQVLIYPEKASRIDYGVFSRFTKEVVLLIYLLKGLFSI